MSLKEILRPILPDFIKSKIKAINETRELKKFTSQKRMNCVTGDLMPEKGVSLSDIFNSDEIRVLWEKSKVELDGLNIPDQTGGVNPGDRRALYYLISKFKPMSVLEIGTHIGASTIHIAAALKANDIKGNLTTVDIRDVNSTSLKPWLEYGTKYSPAQMIEELKYGPFVNFVTDTSIKYFENCQTKFDFIFLDGDHSALTVYQEIPLALKSLNSNGIILLHDYYPSGKPLWSNNSVITGPYLATERLIKEGADVIVLPLGSLPWATKLNSTYTTLALLMKKSKKTIA
jgi:predicted O-methyltransferase YrrM